MIAIYLFIALITTIYFWFKYKYTYFEKLGIPHMKPSIPFGNIKGVGTKISFGMRLYEIYTQTKHIKSPIAGYYIFHQPIAIIKDLDLLKAILIKDFDNFNSRNLYYNEKDDPLSAHLVNIEGQKWRTLRTKLTPTFTSGKMKFMFSTIVAVGEKFFDAVNDIIEKKGNEIEVHDIFGRFTTDVIGSCAFGIDCNSLKDANAEFRLKGLKIFQPRLGMILQLLATFIPNFCRKIGIKLEHDDVTEFFSKALKDTIKYREENKIRRNDFLDMMIEFKNSDNPEVNLTFNEIAAQAYVFFAAGFETSSTALAFCLYELAKNPDIQEKVRQEVLKVLADHKDEFSYDAMMDMKYLQQVIDETLRKYPPIPNVPRRVENDYKIENTDITLSKGMTVSIPIYGIHHDPDIYTDPEKFDPNRFHPDEIHKRHPMAYLPFGHGPRNCIGLRFGKIQAYVGLAYLLKHFKISPSSKTPSVIKFSPKSFLLFSVTGIPLKIEKL